MSLPAEPPVRAFLRVPSQDAMLATVRVFVGGFLARYADAERIDDVRVAVGEACARMRGDGTIVSIEVDRARCTLTCEGVAPPGEDDEDVMRAQLLEALADDIEWFRDDAVSFRMSLSV